MFKLTPLPAFDDNYIWVIESPDDSSIAVVDPGDADVVEQHLTQSNKTLAAILVTHHHRDHTGGVDALNARYSVPVYGSSESKFPGVTHPLSDGDSIELFGASLSIKAVPAHTLDHIAYLVNGDTPQLFCGDTLFLAGCGRLFEGSADQMQQAMDYFASLPDATEVYCTHEYSLANLAFAKAADPANSDIDQAITQCEQLRSDNRPTLPSSIGLERQINPYMRTREMALIKSASHYSNQTLSAGVETLAALREWKNSF
ncbi:hydroxyacylglutathione hydrolase [Marinobacterium sp. xm-a-152]|uniref:hydroxyacylglutathione hydrolase n=1 Tax=Marinobacterium sp. xm-a-152 TaxID=2497733 RepID=UPI001568759B|nr:hydroxyacylglutathione hydrolase [Marinobacterium sp. xm-a-152]NRP16257.1 Hydroxyacylglutathione hydrolase [Marinobacterium sp. xm-a-152]